MSVKLVLLKSGEDIVTDVQEMIVGEKDNQKVVGYFFNKPCIVKTGEPQRNEETGRTAFDINLSPWIALGKGYKFPVPLDWLVTFVDPVEELYQMYVVDILGEELDEEQQSQSMIITDSCEDC